MGLTRIRVAKSPPASYPVCCAGARKRTLVPRPTSLSISNLPPTTAARSCMLLRPTPTAVSSSNPRPSSEISATKSLPSTLRLTETLSAPEWYRTLVSASRITLNSSTPTSPAGLLGTPSSTTSPMLQPGVNRRFSSTNDSTDFAKGRSFSPLRSWTALLKPKVARPKASSSSSRSSPNPEPLFRISVSLNDCRTPTSSWRTTSCRSRAILRRSSFWVRASISWARRRSRSSSARLRSVTSIVAPYIRRALPDASLLTAPREYSQRCVPSFSAILHSSSQGASAATPGSPRGLPACPGPQTGGRGTSGGGGKGGRHQVPVFGDDRLPPLSSRHSGLVRREFHQLRHFGRDQALFRLEVQVPGPDPAGFDGQAVELFALGHRLLRPRAHFCYMFFPSSSSLERPPRALLHADLRR